MSEMYKNILRESIERYVKNIAPGLIHTLNLYCRRLEGSDCLNLFLEEPWAFRDILTRIYGSSPTVEIIVRMFIHPVRVELGINESLDDLVRLFLDNPVEFQRILERALSNK